MKTTSYTVPDAARDLNLQVFFDQIELIRLLESSSLHDTAFTAAAVHYARFRQDGNLLLGMTAADAEDRTVFFSATVGRAESQGPWSGESSNRWVRIPEMSAVLRSFEADRKLTALPRMLDMTWLRRKLQSQAELVEPHWRVRRRKSDLEWARYKPERRAIACVQLALVDDATGERREDTMFLRYVPRIDDTASRNVTTSAHAAGLVVPRTLASLGHGIQVESAVPGTPMTAENLTPDIAREAGALIARLHSAVSSRVRSSATEFLSHRHHWVPRELNRLDTESAKQSADLVERLARLVPSFSAPRSLHGDFHVGQLLATSKGLGLIDFDRVCVGSPAYELAVFHAHLVEDAGDRATLLQEALEAGYSDVRSLPPSQERAWFRAATLLMEAASGFRRGRVDWLDRLQVKIEVAADTVRSLEARS